MMRGHSARMARVSKWRSQRRNAAVFRIGAVAVGVALIVGACGDDDGAGSGLIPTTTTTAASNSGGPGTTGGGSGTQPSGPSGVGALSLSDCIAVAQALASVTLGALGGVDPQSLGDALDQMSAVAPTAIQNDLTTMAETLAVFVAALTEEGIDLGNPSALAAPGAAAALQQASEAFEASGFEEASENVGNWFDTSCEGVGG